MINSVWKEIKIKDCAEVVGGGTPSTKNKEFWDGNIPWISPKDLSKNSSKYITKGERFITEKGLKNSSARILPLNSLVFSSRAPIGHLAINKKPIATNQGFKSLILKKGYDTEYFYYLFKNKLDYIKSYSSGSTFQEISGSVLKNLQFKIPSYEEQKNISSILLKIDKKIEHNLRINFFLKNILDLIFKSWFINFDPTKLKIKGKSLNLAKDISDLFPDTFESVNFKTIPSGWKVCCLGDIINRSKSRVGEKDRKVFAATSSGELVLSEEYFSKRVFSKSIKNYLILDKYDFAYNPSRINIGSIGMNKNDFIGCVSPVYIVFKPKKDWQFFINQFLKLDLTNSKIKQLASGSVRQSLSFDDFASIPIIIPPLSILREFNSIYEILTKKISINLKECEILNSLLKIISPKITSGEFRP